MVLGILHALTSDDANDGANDDAQNDLIKEDQRNPPTDSMADALFAAD